MGCGGASAANTTDMDLATTFFNTCEAGKGWEGACSELAIDGPFDCQGTDPEGIPPISACTTISQYTEWVKTVNGAFGEAATVDLHASGWDEDAKTGLFYATFAKTAKYVYALKVNADGKVCEMTKIWNDAHTGRALAAAAPAAEAAPASE
eukprot:TRINITY_DN8246_c0_g1_i4.p2 TRINITY_DN8246_c0_g1~~TRINITY_DN8246_c0_g1_i4.p2  ORF type:complete len:151 (-),score=33.51 TRINITY_DN8246_c0_g1_i4:163-615(-)